MNNYVTITANHPYINRSFKFLINNFIYMKNDFIIVTIGRNRLRKIHLKEILYIKASGSYSEIHFIDHEIVITVGLKEIDSIIDNESFIRINRSYIININKCIEINTGKSPNIILSNKIQINISKNFLDLVLKHFYSNE